MVVAVVWGLLVMAVDIDWSFGWPSLLKTAVM